MSLQQLAEELVYMGFTPNKYSKMLNSSNGSSVRITITGLNRLEILSRSEIKRLQFLKSSECRLYIERRVFGLLLWRCVIE